MAPAAANVGGVAGLSGTAWVPTDATEHRQRRARAARRTSTAAPSGERHWLALHTIEHAVDATGRRRGGVAHVPASRRSQRSQVSRSRAMCTR